MSEGSEHEADSDAQAEPEESAVSVESDQIHVAGEEAVGLKPSLMPWEWQKPAPPKVIVPPSRPPRSWNSAQLADGAAVLYKRPMYTGEILVYVESRCDKVVHLTIDFGTSRGFMIEPGPGAGARPARRGGLLRRQGAAATDRASPSATPRRSGAAAHRSGCPAAACSGAPPPSSRSSAAGWRALPSRDEHESPRGGARATAPGRAPLRHPAAPGGPFRQAGAARPLLDSRRKVPVRARATSWPRLR